MKKERKSTEGYISIYVGDYSVLVWKKDGESFKDAVKRSIAQSIAQYGLKVVEA